MSKIILKETKPDICQWFCESCGQLITGVEENLKSVPLIEKCPHCGITFDGYELCERRKQFVDKLWKFLTNGVEGDDYES